MKLNSNVAKLGAFLQVTRFVAISTCFVALSGCSLIPESRFRDALHNPFPQIKRVAVLPFYNQSGEPTVNGDAVAEAYYAELQAIPGFEVLPVGVTKAQWFQFASAYGEPQDGAAFQRLARFLGVEAVIVGSVTDFEMYYPPRLAMTVHWYAANEGFHSIPAGYGLPWGTEAEKEIPRRIVREAEFELARSQLATQSPQALPFSGQTLSPPSPDVTASDHSVEDGGIFAKSQVMQASGHQPLEPPVPGEPDRSEHVAGPIGAATGQGVEQLPPESLPPGDPIPGVPSHNVLRENAYVESTGSGNAATVYSEDGFAIENMEAPLPAHWPDPTDLIPDPPSPHPAPATTSHKPVLSHTRIYRADDPYFTKRLSDHVETGDDARPGGWQGYLKRSDDFIRFCCHLHIAEMLESRGGSDESDLILRWPLSRY